MVRSKLLNRFAAIRSLRDHAWNEEGAALDFVAADGMAPSAAENLSFAVRLFPRSEERGPIEASM